MQIRLRLGRRAIGRIQGIVVIVVLLIAIAAGAYYYSTSRMPTQASTSTSTVQFPTSLVVEEESQPDSLDPAVTYTTPGWEVVEQVYQGLLAPNGTSFTTYIGSLAQNWTVSSDGMTYTFNLRPGVTFSNGDPFNAYVEWFSIYRTLVMNQAPAWILGQNLAASNGAGFNITDSILNSINYTNPSQKDLSYMTFANQSVEVVSSNQLVLHLGYGYNGKVPYSAFLATLITPMAMAVDPNVVEANGGVVAGQPNNYLETHALGTSFYKLQSWVQGQSISLLKNQNYWGTSVPPSDLNYAIQPAILDAINFYYKGTSAMIADLQSNAAQMIIVPSTQYNVLKQAASITANIMPIVFGSSESIIFIYMDPYAFAPFHDLRVRQAVSYAIDYKSIIHSVYNDLATQWIGPVPPGFPEYNASTSGLQPYQYNPTMAASLLAQAGYKSTLPNGTALNPTGRAFPSVNFLYDADNSPQSQAAQIISGELQTVGITITLSPLTFKQYANVIYSSENVNSTAYPFGISYYSEDYTAAIDYVTAITTTGQVGFSGFTNQTVTGWTVAAASSLDEGTVIQNFQQITRAMYYDYTNVWLVVPYFMAANRSNVAGMIPNPAGSGMGYFMFYNTVHYTS
ncbi:MAG TPA: ABC transporter substrate-binding protein [Candidatus Dormibacteraeota bacterium]|nr:ABC transporter substrate-binding protein [Candidatus Dormibacteraeota bacterium]